MIEFLIPFARRKLDGQTCTINGDGRQESDLLFVGDYASANASVLGDLGLRGIYNLGSGIVTSVNTLFESLAQATEYAKPAVYGPPKLSETFASFSTPRGPATSWAGRRQ